MTPVLQNENFSNYPAFKANFEDVFIYKIHKEYVVFKEPYDSNNTNGFIFFGSFETVNGWLYGAVMAANKIVIRKESAS